MNIIKINTNDKTFHYIYYLILWITFSIFFSTIFFHDNRYEKITSVKNIMIQIEENENEQNQENSNIKHLDSLALLLSLYNEKNINSHIQSNIIYELNEIKKRHSTISKSNNSGIYLQANDFYSALFYDKKAIYSTLNNIIFLKENLNQCEIGFQQNQNNITLLETLQNNSNK